MTVGIVVVSHSSKIAEGACELAAQMAPAVRLEAAGGTDDGGLGTSLEKVMAAIESANSGEGVVILCDLGSAVMVAESAVEFLGTPQDVSLADAPLIEGLVAASVAAQGGAGVAAVKAAAESALAQQVQARIDDSTAPPVRPRAVADDAGETVSVGGAIVEDFEVLNQLGLHARPAAVLAGYLGGLDVEVDINGADGQSVMMLMTLAAGQGTVLHVRASGPDARRAMDFIAEQCRTGFGEL
ncbi:dihydroxyacetone kinase phosphoryl donor subunit DhaM [Arthrobacter woluwensis]|jgi:phosphoenolpyruvate---glycerone phosphotransferase subunit DhaM|uniref:dihydroxyacetone kinase phosphoryl donor subunit DhaM n=1 Tax=Arthrobacter woluwensis TaxID=156980 RepID=UPI000D11FD5B|nr:dihydroxyacetone kinase phosphoryl donor subunit DhaM [Arthrobacter woluwensis]PSS43421.1 dihydroxyacetone kinase [Arthrobacter woluwensis]QTF73049.1 HPr family phosphocarrier protein [Arthrobacter woluwensis]